MICFDFMKKIARKRRIVFSRVYAIKKKLVLFNSVYEYNCRFIK